MNNVTTNLHRDIIQSATEPDNAISRLHEEYRSVGASQREALFLEVASELVAEWFARRAIDKLQKVDRAGQSAARS